MINRQRDQEKLPEPVPNGPPFEPALSNFDRSAPLLPPRPNLGPEAWPESIEETRVNVEAITFGFGLFAILLLLIGFRWLSQRHRNRTEIRDPVVDARTRATDPSLPAPDRLLAQAEAIRESLIKALGPQWGARTTEELVDSEEIVQQLEPEQSQYIIAILRRADQLKFAGDLRSNDSHLNTNPESSLSGSHQFSEVLGKLLAGLSSSNTGK